MSLPSSLILYEAAKETLVEYFQKTSLNGFGLLYYIRRRKYQRTFWFMFIAMGVFSSIYVCTTIMLSFLEEPTVTALDPQRETIWEVPFPSIAVCSNNKLSRNAVGDVARTMSKTNPISNSTSYWIKKFELFAGYFNTDSIDFDEAMELQNLLDAAHGGTFNTQKVLQQLAPKCQDLVVSCVWSGLAINCERVFKPVAFAKGHCCVFNYHHDRSKANKLYYINGTGTGMGLSLLLNASSSDFFYAEGSSNGFTITLFDDQRIPDASTGQIGEFRADAGDDVEIELKLHSQISTSEARGHPVARRGCYFPNEHKEAAHGSAACLLNCKIRSVENLCDCIPFYAFEQGTNQNNSQCTLAQIECLERYRVTWQTFNPTNTDVNDHLKAELLDSLSCPECRPLCSFHKYQLLKTTKSLRVSYNQRMNKMVLSSTPMYSPDLCVVHIYSPSKYGTRYQKSVLYNWYQILANIGGVIGICMGCSIISGYEIIYFGVVRLFENYVRLRASRT